MNYKELFENLEIYGLDFSFCMSDEQINKIDMDDYDFMNNLAFSPVVKESKEKVFKKLLNKTLDNDKKKEILTKIHNFYDEFYDRFNSERILIRELTKYVFDWVKINSIQIDAIKKNVTKIKNRIFVFYIIHKFYNEGLYDETVILIDQLFLTKYFTDNDEFYNDLLLYKLLSLKNENKYLDNEEIFKEVCRIVQKLDGFEYIRIITHLECALNKDDVSEFTRILNSNFSSIEEWELYEILNVYELSIYTYDKYSIRKIEHLLSSKDIEIFFEDEYFLIFEFLQAVKNNNTKRIQSLKKKLEGEYDFNHFDKFYKKEGL